MLNLSFIYIYIYIYIYICIYIYMYIYIYMSSYIFEYFSTPIKKWSCISMVCQVLLLFFRGVLLLVFISQRVQKVLIKHCSVESFTIIYFILKNWSARFNCIATWIIPTCYFPQVLQLLQYVFFTPVTITAEVALESFILYFLLFDIDFTVTNLIIVRLQ